MRFLTSCVVAAAVSVSGVALATASEAAEASGEVVVVQAVPGTAVDVSIDGRSVADAADVGAVLGPFDLKPGRHEVRFTDASGSVELTSTLSVDPDSSSDVVLHRPASVDGDPVVSVYRTPRRPVGPGLARVLVAHTATVAPADVRVDGTTVFTNIANGEYAEAAVPAGDHRVALLPTGSTTNPILGPLDVTVKPRTITMIYAVGNPTDRSMNVITHIARIASDGSVAPDTIDTGSAALAADKRVSPFNSASQPVAPWGPGPLLWIGGLLATVLLVRRRLRVG